MQLSPNSLPAVTVSQPLAMSTGLLSIINIYQCLHTGGAAAPSLCTRLALLQTITLSEELPETMAHAGHTNTQTFCPQVRPVCPRPAQIISLLTGKMSMMREIVLCATEFSLSVIKKLTAVSNPVLRELEVNFIGVESTHLI